LGFGTATAHIALHSDAMAKLDDSAHHTFVSLLGGHTQGGSSMNLSAPTQAIFWISLILAILALIGYFVVVPFLTLYAFWIAIAAYVVLAAGCLMKGA
jgi:hypothetical protein